MEKLQKAIAQARLERAAAKRDAPADAAPRKRAAPEQSTGLWSEIPRFEPNLTHLTKRRVVSHSSTTLSTPFDIMRTRVLQQMKQNGWKRLMVTSPGPGCGKTTLAANLAFGIARQGETSAIVMDLDLRRPGMADIFGHKPRHDVCEMLVGEVPFEHQAIAIGDRVAVSLVQRSRNDPTRFLNSTRTAEKLDALERDYAPDLMIFDVPPLLVNDDTRSFLPQVDCVVIVARAEKTKIKEIDICEREIAEQTNVLGVILNQSRFEDESQNYGYGYY